MKLKIEKPGWWHSGSLGVAPSPAPPTAETVECGDWSVSDGGILYLVRHPDSENPFRVLAPGQWLSVEVVETA